jgi:hypothetical protein
VNFQRAESELKKKHPAAYPGGFKSPPRAVFANPAPGRRRGR